MTWRTEKILIEIPTRGPATGRSIKFEIELLLRDLPLRLMRTHGMKQSVGRIRIKNFNLVQSAKKRHDQQTPTHLET